MIALINTVEKIAAMIAAISVVLIMFIVAADAGGRYIFNSPLPWAIDVVSQYLMVVAVYFAISQTYRYGDHIGLDLVQRKMPKKMRAGAEVVYSLLSAIVFILITYGGFQAMSEAYQGNEFLPGIVQWPVWLSYLPIVLGAALLAVRLVVHCYFLGAYSKDENMLSHAEVAE